MVILVLVTVQLVLRHFLNLTALTHTQLNIVR